MSFSDLDPLPTAPARTDSPDVFIERADAFVAAMTTFSEQLNVFITELETAAALIAAAPAYADPGLVALTGNTPAADKVPYYTGSGASALTTLTSQARSLLDDTSFGAMLTTLGLSAFGQTLVDDADAATARTTLGLGSAATTASTAYEAAGAVSSHSSAPSGVHGISSFMATVLDDADAAAARTTLGALSITASDLTDPGYIHFSNGFKIQGGTGTISADTTDTITYPIAFTSSVWACVVSGGVSSDSIEGDVHGYGAPGLTTQTIANSGGGGSANYSWIAIGV